MASVSVDSDAQIFCVLVFCLLVLSVTEEGLLKPPAIIVNFSVSLCSSVSFSFHILKLCYCVQTFRIIRSF